MINFFKKHFNRYNIDTRKTRILIPSFFIGYIILIYLLSILLNNLFPFEGKSLTSGDGTKELNLMSLTLFLVFTSIMEEFKYRGLLTKFNYKWILISISVFVATIVFLIFDVKVYYLYAKSLWPIIVFFIKLSIVIISIYFILFKLLFKYGERIKKIFDSNFNVILLTQAFLFAMWHILFSGQGDEGHFVNLFIFHSVAALFYSFIRINYGILYSIIVHFLHNFLISVAPILLVRLIN